MTSFTCMKCGRSAPDVEPSGKQQKPVCQSCHDRPNPGPSKPTRRWHEFEQLEQAVHDYLDHEPEDPKWDDIWRALGAIMGGYQRDAFIQAFDVDERADRPCIRRLITGDDECIHKMNPDAGEALFGPMTTDSDGPPHEPPASDHATLWLDDGEPAVYSMHVYPGNIERLDSQEPPHNLWFDVFEFAEKWGLELSILPKSWYNLGSTVHVIFYPPERYRSES